MSEDKFKDTPEGRVAKRRQNTRDLLRQGRNTSIIRDKKPKFRKRKFKRVDKTTRTIEHVDTGAILGHTHSNIRSDHIPAKALKKIETPSGRNQPIPVGKRLVLDEDVTLLGGSGYLIVHNSDKRPIFLEHGIIGTPVGSQKTIDSTLEFDLTNKPFTLSSYDVFYAYEIGLISPNPRIGTKRTKAQLHDWGVSHDRHFNEKYHVYKELKKQDLIVMDGLQYGVDFVVFKDSAQEFVTTNKKDHSFMMIQVVPDLQQMSSKDVIKGRRLGKRIRKDYVLAHVNGDRTKAGILMDEENMFNDPEMSLWRFNDRDERGAPILDTRSNIDALIIRKVGKNEDIPIVPFEIVDNFKTFDRRNN